MSTTTTNYGWTKPGSSDLVDVTVLDGDLDSIDTVMATKATTAAFSAHTGASTSVHGIADTSKLVAINVSPTFAAGIIVTAEVFKQLGIAGSNSITSRFVGTVNGGAPGSGAHLVGDVVVDVTGRFWICTVAGTPGTWLAVGDATGTATLNANTYSGEQVAPDFKASGLTGTTYATRLVGGHQGAPTTGTYALNDLMADPTGKLFICTVAGTPGTWVDVSSLRAVLGANTFTAEQTMPDVKVTGLTGAATTTRLVGATASGAPVSGTFAIGDVVVDLTSKLWLCTTAGTPGTWQQISGRTLNILTKTGSYSLAVDDDVIVYTGSGAATLTLLAAGSAQPKQVVIKNNTSQTLTIQAASGTIDGSASVSTNIQYTALTFIPFGANWLIV